MPPNLQLAVLLEIHLDFRPLTVTRTGTVRGTGPESKMNLQNHAAMTLTINSLRHSNVLAFDLALYLIVVVVRFILLLLLCCCAGPWVSETERIQQVRKRVPKVEATFPEQLLLAAPPLLFQQRGDAELCNLTAMQIFLQQQFDLVRASHCRIASDCPKTTSQADIYTCKTQSAGTSKHFGLNTKTLQGESGFADFLYTMADNDVIVREEQVLLTREFLDPETTSAKIVVLLYSPSNGDSTLLTLTIAVDGTQITTAVTQNFFGFLDPAQRVQSLYYYASILAVCITILLLNLSLFLESNSLCKQYGIIRQVIH